MKAHDEGEAAQPNVRHSKPLAILYQGQVVRFQKVELDRTQLYGSRHSVALDGEGRECATALLTRDGKFLLPSGSTADLYLNEAGDAVERRDLVAVDDAGTPLPIPEPTTDEPLELQGPFPARDLLEYVAVKVHALRAEVPTLAAALGAGSLFRVPCRARRTAVDTTTFLVGSDAGLFLVQAEPCGFDFVGPEQIALPGEDTEGDDEDAFAFTDPFGTRHDGA